MKIVLSADLHLGRTSTRLPDAWREAGRSIRAWQRLVEATIEEKADLLLLSGDILDHRNHLWEAMGPLQQGIESLAQAGIRCLAVSGNHDATSLPELAAQFPEETFTLLGKKGHWERVSITHHDQTLLHIDGWSFPHDVVTEDPTLTYPYSPSADGIPVIAMVHGDPGVPDSRYAPLSITHLQSLPVSAWLLGHIHRPQFTPGSPWVLMPGSPQPLDPGEPDAHHAWICELENGALSEPRPFCPAAIRYQHITLSITADLHPSVDWIRNQIQQAIDTLPPTEMILCRVLLSGHCEDPEAWQSCSENLCDWTPSQFRIESVQYALHPVIDLQVAAETGPVQALLVQALNQAPPELQTRLDQLCNTLNRQNEYIGKDLPQLEADQLPLPALLEETLRKAMEQMT